VVVPTVRLRQVPVNCPKWNKKMNKASLLAHMERIHGEPCVVSPELPKALLASHQPREHVINWPHVHKKWLCPVEGCPYQARTNTDFHNHFMHRHPHDSIHVTDESIDHWNKGELCGLQHPLPTWRGRAESATCLRGYVPKQRRDIANKILRANEQVFTIDGTPIESAGSSGASRKSRILHWFWLGDPACHSQEGSLQMVQTF